MADNLPCPSCGNERVEEFIPLPEKYQDFIAVICRRCGMRGPIAAWNRRRVSPQLQETIKETKSLDSKPSATEEADG